MERSEAIFTYQPLPHSDEGIIWCEQPIKFSARVIRHNHGKKFEIRYEGNRNSEVDQLLQKMHDWFYVTHIKNSGDVEF